MEIDVGDGALVDVVVYQLRTAVADDKLRR